MKDYKLSDGYGMSDSNCPVKRYPIKANGPVDYAIPNEAEFYRIKRDMETDAFCLEFYVDQCKNCRKVPYAREHSGKAKTVEIKLKKRSAVSMDKKWKFD